MPYGGNGETAANPSYPYGSLMPKGKYVVSFWVGNITTDVHTRALTDIVVYDSLKNMAYYDQAAIQFGEYE